MNNLFKGTNISNKMNFTNLKVVLKLYSYHILIATIIAVSVVSFSLWYKTHNTNNTHRDGGQYLIAVNKIKANNVTDGLEIFKELSSSSSNYAALAKFNLASYAIYKNDHLKALNLLSEVFNNPRYSTSLRDLALLYHIELNYENKSATQKETMDALNSYINANKQFKYSAQEFLIALYINQQFYSEASKLIDILQTDTSVPVTLAKRVTSYQALIK